MKKKAELLAYSLLQSIIPVMPELRGKLPETEYASLADAAAKIVHHTNRSQTSEKQQGLESLYNRLNNNKGRMYLHYHILKSKEPIPCPVKEQPSEAPDLENCKQSLAQWLPAQTMEDVDALLERIERNLACLPAYADISLYDAAKMCCAVTACLYDCQVRPDPWEELRKKELFLLYSFDTSGIQSFIYTIISKDALKMLRARSFYLEIIMEAVIDELLRRLALSRANLIYAGGGHAYLLLPNTDAVRETLATFAAELHEWLLDTFRISLYVAAGMQPCSADDLANIPDGRYTELFRAVSQQISEQKLMRYTPQELITLNSLPQEHERECHVCRRSDHLTEDNLCSVCAAMTELGKTMPTARYYTVSQEPGGQVLPFGQYLRGVSKAEKLPDGRIYIKNDTDDHISAHRIWMGDYIDEQSQTFKDLAAHSTGIKRLAVLRADVDNLGQAFVAGYPKELRTLSRTSAFSGSLSRFFKLHINEILRNEKLHKNRLDPEKPSGARHAAIVYAGGDDVFVVGAWDEVIEFAIDLHNWLNRYSQGKLTISAGIGIYKSSYPISAMARETGELEDCSKNYPGKNAVTLFDESNRYSWIELEQDVIGKKMQTLHSYFLTFDRERGNSLLYQMMALIRDNSSEDRMNVARFAYLLARLRPDNTTMRNKEKRSAYEQFANKLYEWVQDPEESRKLLTAIRLYIYLTRNDAEGSE